MAYTFELRPLRNPAVLAQLAEALDERAYLIAHPRSDRTTSSPKERVKRRATRYRVYLAALLVMGLSLLALGLKDPSGQTGALLGGAALAVCGALWLWFGRKPRTPRGVSSKQLMQQVGKAGRAGARVVFSEEGMSIQSAQGGQELVPYGKIQFGFELDDLLVLTGERRAVALQTLELAWGDWDEFRDFLLLRIDELIDLRKQKREGRHA